MQLLKAFVTSLLVTAAVAAKVQGADKRQAGECDDQLCRTTCQTGQMNGGACINGLCTCH